MAKCIETDVVIIGAGPCGLFQVFELGLLGIQCHLVESLPYPGGQCIELYPDKPIYDIPALPRVESRQLIENLLEQIDPFDPVFHLSQQVTELEQTSDGRYLLETTAQTRFLTKSVVIAAGAGSFEPVRLKVSGVEEDTAAGVFYSVKSVKDHAEKEIVVLGGGDSALDWALELQKIASSVLLIHRSDKFKASQASVTKMQALCAEHEMQYLQGNVTAVNRNDDGGLRTIDVRSGDGLTRQIELDQLLVFFGLSPKPGPLVNWELTQKGKSIVVDTERFQTNRPGIYAIGDINWYPGKKKLILSGFHEAALAAFAIKAQLEPDTKVSLQYTTTSSLMHDRLGVANPYVVDDEAAA